MEPSVSALLETQLAITMGEPTLQSTDRHAGCTDALLRLSPRRGMTQAQAYYDAAERYNPGGTRFADAYGGYNDWWE